MKTQVNACIGGADFYWCPREARFAGSPEGPRNHGVEPVPCVQDNSREEINAVQLDISRRLGNLM